MLEVGGKKQKQFRNIKIQSRTYSRNYFIISVEGLWLEVGRTKIRDFCWMMDVGSWR
jgi:hypothetical protein